jgi:hypothetical protein
VSALDELDFAPAVRAGERNRHERRYYDFTINGRPLRTMLDPGDNVTPFGWLAREQEVSFARPLLLRAPSPMPSGRVPLYICPECGDLGCGALTARVVEDHESFAWLDLAFETDYQEVPPTDFLEVRPFYFEKRAYEAAIRRWWPRTRT